MIAATCFSTFDVSSEHIPAVLSTEEDFSIAIQCAVIVHDNKPPSLSDGNSPYLARMLSRHRRLLHHLESTFRQSNEAGLLHADAYDKALAKLWNDFHPDISSRWHVPPESKSWWISCRTKGGDEVHYDLLTGKLLVRGKPMGRLPQEIVEHPTYASVLGTVSDQTATFLAFPEFFFLENSRRGSCYQSHFRNGIYESIRCVRIRCKSLVLLCLSVVIKTDQRSSSRGITGI